jgi:CRP/FNR family transcriptional regulator
MIRQRNAEINLYQINALAHLDAPVLQALTAISRVYYLKPGEVLLRQCDIIRSFYIIQQGGVRLVEYLPDGQSVCLKMHGAGEILGLLAVSGGYPHSTQIEAIHDSVIIAVDGQDARQLMLEYPPFALTVIDLLTTHVHYAHERVRQMAAKRVDCRLAHALLQLCQKFGKDDGAKISIEVPLSQRDLAEFTSATVETINRTLTQWEKQGIVLNSHKHIDVLDEAALLAIAENVVATH